MSRITFGIIAGIILGIFAFLGGNYLLKTYFSSYFLPEDVQQNMTKPSINIVSDLVPQKLEIVEHTDYYAISWHTAKPVIGYIVMIPTSEPFDKFKDKLNNPKEALFLKVDASPTTEHKAMLPLKQGFSYFYILEQQGSWVIPYGQKIYKETGANDPYVLGKNK